MSSLSVGQSAEGIRLPQKSESPFIAALEAAGLRPSQNLRRELTELAEEIGVRDKLKAAELLEGPDCRPILSDEKMNGPQKLAKIKENLFRRRYPALTLATSRFQERLSELGLKGRVRISHAPYFETGELTVEFTYTRPDELREILRLLGRLESENLIEQALQAAQDNC